MGILRQTQDDGGYGVAGKTVHTLIAVMIAIVLAVSPAHANEVLESAWLDDIERLTVTPDGLMSEDAYLNADNMVWEGRAAGIPWSVVVEEFPAADTVFDPEEYAYDLLEEYELETNEGDENGMILGFFIDQEDPTNSTSVFAMDENFFPREGLTPERLETIRTDVIEPLLAEGDVDEAVQQGAAWVMYTQMFIQSPRIEQSEQQSTLAFMLQVPGLLVAGLVAVGLVAGALFVRQRDRMWLPASGESQPMTSVWQAGAAARGRVDEHVVSAAIASLVRTGSLVEEAATEGNVSLRPMHPPPSSDPFLTALWQHLVETARVNGGTIPPGPTRELLRTTRSSRRFLEQDLIARGIFSGRHRLHRQWLTYASIGGGFLGLLLIVPSIAALSRIGLLVAVLLLLVSAGILVWAYRRSITTQYGHETAQQWLQENRSTAERNSYALIVWQDQLVEEHSTHDLMEPSSPVGLIRTLRGLGPA